MTEIVCLQLPEAVGRRFTLATSPVVGQFQWGYSPVRVISAAQWIAVP